MFTRTPHSSEAALFYITFNCYQWLPLFELVNNYDLVYSFNVVLLSYNPLSSVAVQCRGPLANAQSHEGEPGRTKIESYCITPLFGQMTQLYQDTSKWWIYYSAIFGMGMLLIAFTGMFIERGKNSFQGRRWKLAQIGIIFPLIFLFLLT